MKSLPSDNFKKKILLHICCAMCSASAVKMLQDEYHVSFYWYNPNIYNTQEYINRKTAAIKYAKELNVLFYEEKDFSYNYGKWAEKSSENCDLCYTLRLEKTIMFAKQNRFDCFSTSLLSSPYQKHDLIKQISNDFTHKYAVEFLYKDYRTCFYDCKNYLRQNGYYMQKFCGCNKSYKERYKV
ncbi:MAG: epoxyqueuosine reductase QueH [Endomicrobium sp.]|jgi:predicted adenine nucleotide alpha hydrolase (AANH) superfamily ATPase|nr:epoxyqueuosine reductase QueH [Endomicrobium sp.]